MQSTLRVIRVFIPERTAGYIHIGGGGRGGEGRGGGGKGRGGEGGGEKGVYQ